jgi:MerR family mercuric resistance operon transcriptional regulator
VAAKSGGAIAKAERAPSLKIGEVSTRGGVGIETLRFYERQGLLGRPVRTESGYRLYDESVLDQLEFVKRAQALGFSLAEIARLTAESRAGQSHCAEMREIVRTRVRELDERLADLKRYRRELATALYEWDEIGDKPGHVCGLFEGSHVEAPAVGKGPVVRRRP